MKNKVIIWDKLYPSLSWKIKKIFQVQKTLTNEELKEVYALYKQATCGDVAIDKPGIADIKYHYSSV